MPKVYLDPVQRGVKAEGRLDVLLVRLAHVGLGVLERRYSVPLVNPLMPDIERFVAGELSPVLAPVARGRARRLRRLR